jgi:hypothetical protein
MLARVIVSRNRKTKGNMRRRGLFPWVPHLPYLPKGSTPKGAGPCFMGNGSMTLHSAAVTRSVRGWVIVAPLRSCL